MCPHIPKYTNFISILSLLIPVFPFAFPIFIVLSHCRTNWLVFSSQPILFSIWSPKYFLWSLARIIYHFNFLPRIQSFPFIFRNQIYYTFGIFIYLSHTILDNAKVFLMLRTILLFDVYDTKHTNKCLHYSMFDLFRIVVECRIGSNCTSIFRQYLNILDRRYFDVHIYIYSNINVSNKLCCFICKPQTLTIECIMNSGVASYPKAGRGSIRGPQVRGPPNLISNKRKCLLP